jgi:hypothetical protein
LIPCEIFLSGLYMGKRKTIHKSSENCLFYFAVSPCINNPCENNGTCSVDVNGNATCTCDGNWNGTYCTGNHIFRN